MMNCTVLVACRNSFLCFFCVFLAGCFVSKIFFGKSRSFTWPLFSVFAKNLDRLAGQPIQIICVIQIWIQIFFRFTMYSYVTLIDHSLLSQPPPPPPPLPPPPPPPPPLSGDGWCAISSRYGTVIVVR